MIKFLKKHQKSASLLWKPPQLLWTQKNLRIGQTKIYDSFLSKNVYKTEIDKVELKLWRFTLGTLILGHPVYSIQYSLYYTAHSTLHIEQYTYCIDIL